MKRPVDPSRAARLRRNVPGVLICEADTGRELYDGAAPWRDRALRGTLHSGTVAGGRAPATPPAPGRGQPRASGP